MSNIRRRVEDIVKDFTEPFTSIDVRDKYNEIYGTHITAKKMHYSINAMLRADKIFRRNDIPRRSAKGTGGKPSPFYEKVEGKLEPIKTTEEPQANQNREAGINRSELEEITRSIELHAIALDHLADQLEDTKNTKTWEDGFREGFSAGFSKACEIMENK